ncbi:hypothetical protein DEU56DRAFT_732685 [Suillus clintonianus]|uniref:uncharacterized protein n=1 Tax=Suillus clintonianus TaxID=1904413 RepID=UPI001B8812EB|nr:uncharacterized protein DEU56DRAFT_732685 [Suillus clintonianus]KAG2144558.1 hypothetical protein DEU56DRAFT_732685 [Suillus clintonianus]
MAKKKATNEKKQARSAGQEGERCNWTSADELRLLDFITTHKAKGGDGLDFNKTFWAQAAIDVAHTTTSGAVKTGEHCSQKWSRMHTTFSVADRVVNFLGISWSNELGANITPESETVWTDLIKVSTYLLF